jgi:hypothetical protein
MQSIDLFVGSAKTAAFNPLEISPLGLGIGTGEVFILFKIAAQTFKKCILQQSIISASNFSS